MEYFKKYKKTVALIPTDKAANNKAMICKCYYVEIILKEVASKG